MPFDPSKPADHSPLVAAEMRAQLTGLKADIDAIPGITSVVVDSVTTVGPGESATVTVSVIGTVLHISLALPRGADGIPGLQGESGVQGPPFANAVIDSVTTPGPGQSASVSVFFDGSNVRFSFAIPQGAQGEQGIQGAQGEVTNATMGDAISSAIEGTPKNTNGVALLNLTVSDPPTRDEVQAVANKIDELIIAQRR